MKNLLSIAFFLLACSIGKSAIITNKINNVDSLYGQTAHSTIKLFNCDFIVTNGNLLNSYAYFDGTGNLVGTNLASVSAAALTNRPNTFLPVSTNTFLALTETSNLNVRGFILQSSSTGPAGSSNTFVATTNSFIGLIKAFNTGTHEFGAIAISGSVPTLSASGSSSMLSIGGGSSSAVGVRIINQGMLITNSLTISNSLVVAQTSRLGTNGTAISFVKSATASLDFPSINGGATADLTITVGGALVGDAVALGRPSAEDVSLVTRGIVTATDTVTVRASNVSAIAVDQGSLTYRAEVTHY